MALDDPQGVLTCGTPLDALIDQVTEHYTPVDAAHQASCRHCQAALVALGEAWGEVQAFARQPVPVPAGLTEWIVSRIRALIARIGDAVVLTGARGETRVSERVVGRAARAAALSVPGVVLPSALRIGWTEASGMEFGPSFCSRPRASSLERPDIWVNVAGMESILLSMVVR